MVAVTYGVASSVDSKSTKERKSIFKALYDAIVDAQMKRAERELARYHYLRADLYKDDKPFVG